MDIAAAFWINCRDLMELSGRPAKSITIVQSGPNKSLNEELWSMFRKKWQQFTYLGYLLGMLAYN